MTEGPTTSLQRPDGSRKALVRKRFPWGWVVFLGLGLVALALFFRMKNAPVQLALTQPSVFKAGERNPVVSASGYIVARTRATLSSKVLGRVSELNAQEGSRVAKGQILARLESPDLEAQRLSVKAQMAQVELDLGRSERLVKEGISDQASLDRLRNQRAALKAQLDYQEALLESMILRAPFSGVVTQKLSEVGETVAPGSAGGANAINAILTLVDFNTLEVEVEVSENGIAKLRKGMPAEVRVDALEGIAGGKPLEGVLREIYPSSNRQKAVVIVRVAFKAIDPKLVPDMGCKVTFLGEPYREDTLILGREQVVRQKGQPFVWVLDKGLAALAPIQITGENPLGYEVKGLAADAALLAVPPDFTLKAGSKVAVKEK
jgi:RND family efflux transporter MFP subunit